MVVILGGFLAEQKEPYWLLRESIAAAAAKRAAALPGRLVHKYDISMPRDRMYDVVEALRANLDGTCPGSVVTGYGHFGDGNIHVNVCLGEVPRAQSDCTAHVQTDNSIGNHVTVSLLL